jgi:hypothetical protein
VRNRYQRLILLALLASTGAAPRVSAAELRVTLTELAGVVQTVMGDAKLHLDNAPGGLFSGSGGSYLAVAGKQTAFPLPSKSFDVLGSTYTYYVEDLNSQSIRVSATPTALRLLLTFDTKAAELTGGCISGDCGLTTALPKIAWKNGTVTIDVVPVRAGSSIALQAKSVTIGGVLTAQCASGGLFSSGTCKLALPWANRTIAKLKPDIAAKLKDKVNDPASQDAVAEGLKQYIAVGSAGKIAVTGITTDQKAVTISFHLAGDAGG